MERQQAYHHHQPKPCKSDIKERRGLPHTDKPTTNTNTTQTTKGRHLCDVAPLERLPALWRKAWVMNYG